MALVSPGVQTSVTNESFFIPGQATTIPVFFIATREGKTQPNGTTPAAGTLEHGIVRTVTSLGQSVQLYGVPYFWEDGAGNQFHGDARNEYGLFALNQFISLGNRAYVVRANVDLSDESTTFLGIGTGIIDQASISVVGVGDGTLGGALTVSSEFVQPQEITVVFNSSTTFTVTGSLAGIIGTGTVGTPFTSTTVNFTVTAGSTPFAEDDYIQFDIVWAPTSFSGTGNGKMVNINIDVNAVEEIWTIDFTSATAFTVTGSVSGATAAGTVGTAYDNNFINFTINAGSTPFATGAKFTLDIEEVTNFNPLGANDAAKRVSIVTALQAAINSNEELRSEAYEFNLVVCPGYPETADEMVALVTDVGSEALVIADTHCNKTPEQTAQWALTSGKVSGTEIAYYYSWGLASNLDGSDVLVAPSGIALRTITFSDNQSYPWFAPAGVSRGTVSGVSRMGYVTGTLGTPTTFVEANLNQGQRDNLYEYNKNINPITFIPGRGILVMGQKTAAGAASALDRINVSRLVMYIRRGLRKGAFPFLFEPNDKVTRDNVKSMADGFLNDIMTKRGLYDFATLCSEENNTPDRIDRNELYLDVALKPVKAVEFVYIPIRVLSTGAEM